MNKRVNEDEHQKEGKRKGTATGVECRLLLPLLQLIKKLLLLDGVDRVSVDAQHPEAQQGAHQDVVLPLQR